MDTKALKKRRESAKKERDSFQPLLDEAFKYAIPMRKSTKNTGQGESRVDQVFDHTAIDSAYRFAGKVQQDFWPAGQQNFGLEPGPLVRDAGERDQMAARLTVVTDVAQAFFDDGDWDIAFGEMALELSAGTGAILMNSSSNPNILWEPISVSIEELMLEQGVNNKISGIFWDRKMSIRVLKDTWPDGKFGLAIDELFSVDPEKEIPVNLDTIYDAKAREWNLLVWSDKQDEVIFKETSTTCPWLSPRYFRVPGETYGRGPVMLAMPTIKTLNTVARLQLQGAAIALLGIFTAVDDGVFNPSLAPVEPGAFWKVARNGGPMGPSVNRFPDPRLDLSNMVLNDMRMGVKATMMDQSLPPDAAAVRSATEIMERVKRLASDHLGAYGRLIKEVTIPAVRRVIELAYKKGLLGNEIPIDQLLIKVKIKSPLAIAQEARRLEKIVQWMQMVLMTAQQMQSPVLAGHIMHLETMLVDIGRSLGVPNNYILSTDERNAVMEQEQKQQQAALVAQAAAGALQGGLTA